MIYPQAGYPLVTYIGTTPPVHHYTSMDVRTTIRQRYQFDLTPIVRIVLRALST